MTVVLIVDDMAEIVRLLTKFIQGRGYTVVSASNGVSALTVAREQHPHLVISDIRMPYMDGHDLLRILRTDPAFAATRIYLISADSDTQAQPGDPLPDGYIEKPFDFATIAAVLDSLALQID